MRLSIGASHCEIDAKVLKEVGLEMHLHTHSEGFRDGLVGTFLAAEGMGLAQPLVSLGASSVVPLILYWGVLASTFFQSAPRNITYF